MRLRSLLAGVVALVFGSVAAAQDALPPSSSLSGLRSQILTIDSSRLFPETRLGQLIISAINEERRAFAAEGQQIADRLRAEELQLTEQRALLSREEFAALARDFDDRVTATRTERDAVEAELNAKAEAQERAFLGQVRPILGQLMAEAGAAVLIESDTVFLRNDAIDITEIAIARINEATVESAPLDGAAPAPQDGDTSPAPSPNDGAETADD